LKRTKSLPGNYLKKTKKSKQTIFNWPQHSIKQYSIKFLWIRRAKLLLKKKRYQEQLIDKTDKQLDLVEQMVHDLEFTQVEMQVLESLKAGNESLKAVQKLFSIEDVEKIMDEAREGIEKQRVFLLFTMI